MIHSIVPERTLLVDDAGASVSAPLCGRLALAGARLLLLGDNEERLVDLDASLAQAELHRYSSRSALSSGSSGIENWIKEESPGISGALLLPDPSQPAIESPLLDTLEACLACFGDAPGERSIVVVLTRPAWREVWPPWDGAVDAARFREVSQEWELHVRTWAAAAAPAQICVNLVLAGPVVDAGFSARLDAAAERCGLQAETMQLALSAQLPHRLLLSAADLATSVEPWFSPAVRHTSGQVIRLGSLDYT